MKRSKHNLSHYHLLTGDMGKLIPIGLIEALPGDTFQLATSAMIRVSPLAAPVFHPVNIRVHHFFVPHRLVWPEAENAGWENFITGGPDGNNAQVPPQQTLGVIATDNIFDYYGAKVADDDPGPVSVNAMPIRGYNAIWNEFYRDQDLQAERIGTDATVADIGWGKDYFTTARPWTQKGTEVALSIASSAIVKTSNQQQLSGQQTPLRWRDATTGLTAPSGNIGTGVSQGNTEHQAGSAPGGAALYPDNLYADLSAATPVTINEFRRAFALQRYKEARAQYGSRYTEYLRYIGVTPSDARLQRPEFLGGGTARINFSEVMQTAPAGTYAEPPAGREGYGVGDLYGHGVGGIRSGRIRKYCEEHGYIHSFLSVRPKGIYMNGAERHWFKWTKEDYFQKELEAIGQQAINQNEIYTASTNGNNSAPTTFGYQDRYSEYKRQRSHVSGEFRELLNYWHMARDLPANVTLNEDFIKCVPTKRVFNVQTQHTLWAMINQHCVARRMVKRGSASRIL